MNMQRRPIISIIVATFNAAKTLPQCLDSIKQQTYQNKELIIIDGASSDTTVNIVNCNKEHISYFISEPDTGIYDAWNKALGKATGDWIVFLGADDVLWDHDVLSNICNSLSSLDKNLKLAYARVAILNTKMDLICIAGESWKIAKPKLKVGMSIPHQGLFYRRSWFEQYGVFDSQYKIVGDYENLLRGLSNETAMFLPDYICTGMVQGGISSEPKNAIKILKEIRSAQCKHFRFFPISQYLFSLMRIYIRLLLQKILSVDKTYKLLDLGRKFLGKPPYWTKL